MRLSCLGDPAVAVEELLRGSKWCVVYLLETLNQAETLTKLDVKRIGVVTHHFEPATLRRTFRAKGADNDMTARFYAPGDLPDVSNALLFCRKKMEYRAIMPDVERVRFQFDLGDVADKPTHLLRGRTQPSAGQLDCHLRYVEDGNFLVSAYKQIVDER